MSTNTDTDNPKPAKDTAEQAEPEPVQKRNWNHLIWLIRKLTATNMPEWHEIHKLLNALLHRGPQVIAQLLRSIPGLSIPTWKSLRFKPTTFPVILQDLEHFESEITLANEDIEPVKAKGVELSGWVTYLFGGEAKGPVLRTACVHEKATFVFGSLKDLFSITEATSPAVVLNREFLAKHGLTFVLPSDIFQLRRALKRQRQSEEVIIGTDMIYLDKLESRQHESRYILFTLIVTEYERDKFRPAISGRKILKHSYRAENAGLANNYQQFDPKVKWIFRRILPDEEID